MALNLTSLKPKTFPHFLSPKLSFLSLQTPPHFNTRTKPFFFFSTRARAALREWREYEEAVKRKDLAGALGFLKSIENNHNKNDPIERVNGSALAESTRSRLAELGLAGYERDWEVLDTCLNADDMKLVGSAYGFLKDRGFLPNFGKCRNIALEGPRKITPTVLKSSTGLEVSKLSPKKWGVSGSSQAVLVAFLGGVSFLISEGIDIRPNLAVILGLAFMDSIFLGGCCLAQISSYWPPNRRRILVHEAGHLLIAYLMGCPIRGVILDPIVAMQAGIQGQELSFGMIKWPRILLKEDSMELLLTGIAAEALVYGEAEGGENDENLFRSICLLLGPPLSVAEMSNQARWSVLQSYNLLKWHRHAHRAAVKALENGGGLSIVIRSIEEAMSSNG
ncbi:uncharacterized protein LOC133876545 isoform X2 [Alnus glutinosa]|uniref:uncharacterized protein LOC133876545 isoform X2 n=1 Tax=Alnus glutinosa TaxID=3517 RepID=UPI002D773C7E|nr:uncharacterized protein LOC133876545 isoform X2 [Alnus glutinosa]